MKNSSNPYASSAEGPSLPTSDSAGQPVGSYIWVVVMLLWPVALLNYLDRQMMATMKQSIMTDIPSIQLQANWGILLASFKWVYAGLSPLGGFIADRFSRRWIICASLFVWSLVTCLTGLATTFNQLLVARALMGISEAFYIPAALAMIADYHHKATRSRAIGIHQTAIYAALILGGFTGYAADSPLVGWRKTFMIAGVIGMLYALPLLSTLRDVPKSLLAFTAGSEDRSSTGPARLSGLLSNPSFYFLVLYFTLPAIAGWVVKDWMPSILKDRFHLTQGAAGVYATVYVNIAALIGAFLGGQLADMRMRHTVRGRIQISATGMCMLVPALLGIGYAPSVSVIVLFLVLFGIGWGFFDCNNMPILSQIARPELRATGYGIMNFVSISCGGFADWIYGWCKDNQYGDTLFFTIVALATLFSAGLVLMIRPRAELG